MIGHCRFGTGTATLAVFDPACLEHRLDDVADWWSDPTDEVAEINAGNVLFVATGSDGTYEVSDLRHRAAGPHRDGSGDASLCQRPRPGGCR